MSKLVEEQRTCFVVEVDPGRYLYYCGGDWGPNRTTRDNLFEAEKYSTKDDARRAWKDFSGTIIKESQIKELKIKTIIEIV